MPKEKRTQPQPNQGPSQSDPVDARDLARRLEIYAIELQLRGRSSPPPRRKPPPDTPSTRSPTGGLTSRSANENDNNLLRPDALVPDGLAGVVGSQPGETQHASTIIITQQRGPARPNSFNPQFLPSVTKHDQPQSPRRDSQLYATKSLPKLPDQAQVLAPRAESPTDVWRTPNTTQEATVALEEQLRLKQNGKGLRRADMTAHANASHLKNDSNPALANSEARSRRVDSGHQRDFSDPTRSPQLTVGHLDSPLSTGSSPEQSTLQTRRSERDRPLRKVNGALNTVVATTSERAKTPTGLKIHVRKASTSDASEFGEGRSAAAATNRISANTINLIMADVPHTPSLPAFPSPPSSTIPPGVLAGSNLQVATPGQNAFLAAMLAQEGMVGEERLDWSRQKKQKMADQLDRDLSQSDPPPMKNSTKIESPATGNRLPPASVEQSPTKGHDTKRGRELRMRKDAVKQADAPHLNNITKEVASDAPPVPRSRSASRSRTRQRSVSIRTPRVPQILKKNTKSPGNSRPGSRPGSRPSSRARSRANSDGTRGGGIIASIKPQPLPQKDAMAPTPTPLHRQKSLPLLSAPQPPQDEPVEDSSAALLNKPAPVLQRSISASNYSRPGSSSGAKVLGSASAHLHHQSKTSISVTMPAPPNPVYRCQSRQSIRSFSLNGSNNKVEEVDQTGNMTEASLALLQKMEEELARRGEPNLIKDRAASPSLRQSAEEKRHHDDTDKKRNRGCLGCLGL